MRTSSHILIRETILPNRPLEDFELDFLSYPNLSIDKQEKEIQAYASIVWSIPSLMVVFIASSYFQNFIGEFGSDHYHILKAWVIKMNRKYRNIQTTSVTSSGVKKKEDNSLNNFFAVYHTIPNGNMLKVFMPKCETEEEEEMALSELFDYLMELYKKPNGGFAKKINGLAGNSFDDIYAIYNAKSKKWQYYTVMMLIKQKSKEGKN